MDLFTQILSTNYTKLAAIEALETWRDANPDSPSVVAQEVRERIEALEPLHLFLAQKISDEELAKIADFLRKDLPAGRQVMLLEIKIDPGLIGGCALSYKGVYKNYSVKSKINNSKDLIIKI